MDPAVRIVNRTPPGGFGRAVRSGMEAVPGDIVVVYMADLSDSPEDVVGYYRKIREGYDCVFGSRFIKGSVVQNYPPVKLSINRIVNRCIQFMFWTRFNDLTNAFKAYRTPVIRDCGPYRACHFNLTLEMSLGALIRNYNIAQIPIRWYGRTWGSTKLKLGEMGRRYLSTLLMMFFQRHLITDDLSGRSARQQRRLSLSARGTGATHLQAGREGRFDVGHTGETGVTPVRAGLLSCEVPSFLPQSRRETDSRPSAIARSNGIKVETRGAGSRFQLSDRTDDSHRQDQKRADRRGAHHRPVSGRGGRLRYRDPVAAPKVMEAKEGYEEKIEVETGLSGTTERRIYACEPGRTRRNGSHSSAARWRRRDACRMVWTGWCGTRPTTARGRVHVWERKQATRSRNASERRARSPVSIS